ncbi:hypothetical protein HJC23_007279 [Cyclotella cryptica]|uniref:JmjC domain-containing protein n=1 Tax=Cyclotella cryptica TaxID=29204 RepID=A0ABD3PZF7_9STRA|eukprot:CCRYP_010083-RA/>CCRYP_010083-RA protein AED:0.40 eAED:0.40 QI:0/-1/0/1/-1/1/1/0/335
MSKAIQCSSSIFRHAGRFRRNCRFFSSLLPSTHPFNRSSIEPSPYHGKTQHVPISLLHHIRLQNEDHQIELANTLRPYYESQNPHLLRHLFASCDAIYFWSSLEYWRVAVGDDTDVEVEIGLSYNKGERVTMKFGDYLDYLSLCIESDGSKSNSIQQEHGQFGKQIDVAYLAQNELFSQVQNDIPIPQFCCDPNARHNLGKGMLYHTMLWMGPRHTVSPLHYDPLDNLLIQAVGWKRVLLFPPDCTTISRDAPDDASNVDFDGKLWHYAGVDGNQYNTSAVDIENPDYDRYPNFKHAPVPYECTLAPGDALFIPKKWWHHVRSLDWSVSANIWWR